MTKHFSSKEQVILQAMYRYGSPLTIYEIVKKTGFAWITVKKSLMKFLDKEVVIRTKDHNKTYWEINPELEPKPKNLL